MPPLVRGEVDGLAVLVADVAGIQPPVELVPVGASWPGPLPADVGVQRREQVRAAIWPARQHLLLLGADGGFQLVVDGDGGFPFHLGVDVAQVGGALAVADQAVERQGARGGDPQPAPDLDEGEQPSFGVGPAAEAGGMLDLGHDVLGQCAREPALPAGPGIVLREDHRVRGE